MSDTVNTMPSKHSSVYALKNLTSTQKKQDALLVISIVQLVLSILLYLLASTKIYILITASVAAIVLSLISHFKYEHRIARIILRTLCIMIAVIPFIFSLLLIVPYYLEARTYIHSDVFAAFLSDLWMVFALILLPIHLFLQPVLVINATNRRRFDMVLLRIASVFTCVYAILVCLYSLEFQNCQLLSTSVDLKLFVLSIDSLPIRILFCVCSAVLISLSFLVHSKKKGDN